MPGMQYLKKLLIAITVTAAACQAFAAAPKQPKSGVVNDDSTVSLAVYAPKATSVTVGGDLAPTKMTRGADGIWRGRTKALRPDYYTYFFNIDGVRTIDPANAFTERNEMYLSNYVVTDPELRSQDVPHGTVAKVWGPDGRRMTVYTPAGFDARSDRRYPVLYLLHGLGGDENAWPELGRAPYILDNMIAAGQVEPMIVVMPNGNIAHKAAPGDNPGTPAQPVSRPPRTMNGEFEASFPAIVEWVDSHYPTRTDRASRALAGLSMGGFHTIHIARANPAMFGYIGSFSSFLHPRKYSDSKAYDNPGPALRALADAKPLLLWVGIGKTDFLARENKEMLAEFDKAGLNYEYHSSEGGHTWKNWRDYLRLFLPKLFK